jgi:hypothetical protein
MKRTIKNSIVTEIIIGASAEKVWGILTNLNAFQEWNPFMIKSKGEVKPKARLVNTMQIEKTTMTFKPVVQQVIPNAYFDWVGHLLMPGIFDGHHYFRIESIHDQQVKLVHGENFSGILSSIIFRKIGNDTRLGFIKMNQALKQQAERITN